MSKAKIVQFEDVKGHMRWMNINRIDFVESASEGTFFIWIGGKHCFEISKECWNSIRRAL